MNLEILNQSKVYEDDYSDQYSYDDCVLNQIKEKGIHPDINSILTLKGNIKMTEKIFQNLSEQFESGTITSNCKIPNINLQATFTTADLKLADSKWFNINYFGWTKGVVYEEKLFKFSIDFQQSTVHKEVNFLPGLF